MARSSTSSTTGTSTTTSTTTYAPPVADTLRTQACQEDAVILHVSVESDDEESRNRFAAVLALASSMNATLSDGTSVCSATTVTESSETVEGHDPPVVHEEHRIELNEWLVLAFVVLGGGLGFCLTVFGLARILGLVSLEEESDDEDDDEKKQPQPLSGHLGTRKVRYERVVAGKRLRFVL